MSSRTCPDWPHLMELAPELQFKHYTVREARLPARAVMRCDRRDLDAVTVCCDLERHVFHADHTDPDVAVGLRAASWLDLHEMRSDSGSAGRGELDLVPGAARQG